MMNKRDERRPQRDYKEKKTFKETKVGKFLSEKAPRILDTVGDILPDSGALGVVKNLISSDDSISPADKEKALEMLDIELKEFELAVKDRDSARNREIETLNSGRKYDWMQMLTGVIGLSAFVYVIYSVINIPELSDNKLAIHIIGLVEGVVLSIFFYYYGSSKGSSEKNNMFK